MNALIRRRDERRSVEDRFREVFQDADMLLAVTGNGNRNLPDGRHRKAGFRGTAEGSHLDFIAGEREPVILINQPSPFPRDFEPVGTGRLAGRCDKNAGGAILEIEESGDIVLNVDGVITSEPAESPHARGHAEEPLEEIEIMGTLIEQDAAAFAGPGGPPSPAGIVGGGAKPISDDPIDAPDFAQFARLDERADFPVKRVRPLIEHGGKDLAAAPLVGGDEFFAILLVDGNRFLNQHMQAVFERVDSNGGMGEMGSGDEHGVHLAGADE